MTTDVVTVGPETGLKAAARVMVEKGVSGLPVVDDTGVLIGIITEADFVQQEAGKSQRRYRRLLDALFGERETRPHGEVVADAMTRHPVTVDAEARIAEAAREMTDRGIKRLPVVDTDGKLLGIISRADILAAFTRPDDVIEDQIRQDILRRILLIDEDAVEVHVTDGVVKLEGTAPTRTDARLLEELTSRLEGVVGVDSNLSFEVDDAVTADSPPPPNLP
jgi:CBS domain-containing protein